ncbi:penicillin acylase family protein [Hymenobacter sp. H14-R3]|uniref:penicillin acylase family protein n=1 Tax=Hymenobacter sp. H14-R3 TaxID=3046308 RepID=UPI0024B94893|nr:penicillin acylase family protein [Hymenobacter sp. H14-R3]MDJ0364193.1 penicillin acylase family protein [Hymenobacter sp. H14-R3]
MHKLTTLLLLLAAGEANAQAFTPAEMSRWQQQARRVSITRDTWGVPHITGKTDADAVFGLLYSQCEDDFARVEDNYLTALGRQAEVRGEAALYEDLRQRLFLDSTRAVGIYNRSPRWMKDLLHAFADGTNYYLATHPAVRPRLLHRFQPWMPLLFSEGSIGGNVSVVPLERLKAFYSQQKGTSYQPPKAETRLAFEQADDEPTGSNGFAIAPAKSASGHPLLLINPHTSFYFRLEVQMTSAAGLNAYGAVTWGQFFIYQGFNEKCGWMHTSSQADSMDEYLETVTEQAGKFVYQYEGQQLPVVTDTLSLVYLKDGRRQRRTFTTYRTPHGPVVGKVGEKWLTVKMMDTPLEALEQSYLRTKAHDYAGFQKVMRLNGNASNNTVFADNQGTIAYWHGNFMPRRSAGYDFSQPVDGSLKATEWQGLHKVEELVQVRNPASGFIQNCNSTPYTVAGPTSSPAKAQYPSYMAPDAENYRGINAVRVLSRKKVFTLDTLIAAANDPHLAGFEKLLPSLLRDCQLLLDEPGGTLPAGVEKALPILRAWNLNYSQTSVAQTLAIYWAERLQRLARPRVPAGQATDYISFTNFLIEHTAPDEKAQALSETLAELTRDFGKWQVPWGEVNRYQRLTGRIDETFDDQQPSRPVAFTSSAWGSLAAFGAHTYPGTKKRYGGIGNSFVAVVEFGPRVVARSVVTGGQASRPGDKHFTDQAPLYCEGQFKDVWFYPEDVQKHVEKQYRLGE